MFCLRENLIGLNAELMIYNCDYIIECVLSIIISLSLCANIEHILSIISKWLYYKYKYKFVYHTPNNP